MDEPKRKRGERSRWDRFLDVILLAKPFVWEVDWSPEECIECLPNLHKSQIDSLQEAYTVKTTERNDHVQDFIIRMYRNDKRTGKYNGATANGVILADEGTGKTIIQGKIRINDLIFIFDICFLGMLFLMPQFFVQHLVIYGSGCCLISYFSIRRDVADRNKLFDLLCKTFQIKDNSQKRKRYESE